MSDDDDSEKTEDPSPDKLRKAREEGNIARSRDAGSVAATIAVLLIIGSLGPLGYISFRGYLEQCLRSVSSVAQGSFAATAGATGQAIVLLTLPVAGAAALAAILMGMAEAGLQLNWSLIEPKWNRIDPIAKMGQLFSFGSAASGTMLTLARVGVVGWVAYSILSDEFHRLARLPRVPIDSAALTVISVTGRIAFWSTGALAVLSAIDYGQSWWRRHKQLMMSRQELKEEMHQQEGDPKMKGRMRQRAREMARKGLLQEVKRADVIVANPTHVAVALRYRPDEGAPSVTAKGLDDVAQYIKKIAAENGIPVIESRELARGLHAQVKVGKRIPVEFYQAVAELLAYVYRLKRRGLRA